MPTKIPRAGVPGVCPAPAVLDPKAAMAASLAAVDAIVVDEERPEVRAAREYFGLPAGPSQELLDARAKLAAIVAADQSKPD